MMSQLASAQALTDMRGNLPHRPHDRPASSRLLAERKPSLTTLKGQSLPEPRNKLRISRSIKRALLIAQPPIKRRTPDSDTRSPIFSRRRQTQTPNDNGGRSLVNIPRDELTAVPVSSTSSSPNSEGQSSDELADGDYARILVTVSRDLHEWERKESADALMELSYRA